MEWIDKFEDTPNEYITPGNPRVIEEARSIQFAGEENEVEVAKKVWSHIADKIDWKLSKEWKQPEETLVSGMGDCEDLVFLMLSILPNVGVTDAKMVIGYLDDGIKEPYPHVWVNVDGVVMDPSGHPEEVDKMEYRPRETFKIKIKRLAQ